MKIIQHLIPYQFTERAIAIGDKAIKTGAVIVAFILLVLPFVIMVVRLS